MVLRCLALRNGVVKAKETQLQPGPLSTAAATLQLPVLILVIFQWLAAIGDRNGPKARLICCLTFQPMCSFAWSLPRLPSTPGCKPQAGTLIKMNPMERVFFWKMTSFSMAAAYHQPLTTVGGGYLVLVTLMSKSHGWRELSCAAGRLHNTATKTGGNSDRIMEQLKSFHVAHCCHICYLDANAGTHPVFSQD